MTKNISNVTRSKYNKMYRRDCVVAKFIKNNNTINLYYKNYSKKLLKDHMMRDYDEKYVSMYFWDHSFCTYKNISDEDIRSLDRLDAEVDSKVAVSYIMASISLHEIILKTYMDDTRALAKEQGYVETVFGRRLYLPDINARNAQMRNYAERTAINAPMQGTAADIIKRAMISVDDWLRADNIDARIIMQVHDELVLEVKAGDLEAVGEQVQRIMIEAAQLKVPLEVDVGIGNSWEEAH